MILSKIPPTIDPQEGDYKIEKHFAWWPTKVEGFKIWMEPYKKVYEYRARERHSYLRYLAISHYGIWGDWELIAIKK